MLVLKSFILYWNIFVMICVEFRLLYISLLVCKRIKFVGFEFKCLLVDSVIKVVIIMVEIVGKYIMFYKCGDYCIEWNVVCGICVE